MMTTAARGITIYRPDSAARRRSRRWLAGMLGIAVAAGSGAFVNALQSEQAGGVDTKAADSSPFAYFPR